VTTPRGRGSTAAPSPEALGWRTSSAGKSTDAKAQAHGSARVAPTLEMRASRLAVIVRRARRPRPARAGNFQAATLCRRCCYRLQTTGRAGPGILRAPEDWPALGKTAGLSLPPSLTPPANAPTQTHQRASLSHDGAFYASWSLILLTKIYVALLCGDVGHRIHRGRGVPGDAGTLPGSFEGPT
jgi:hypothetical protein